MLRLMCQARHLFGHSPGLAEFVCEVKESGTKPKSPPLVVPGSPGRIGRFFAPHQRNDCWNENRSLGPTQPKTRHTILSWSPMASSSKPSSARRRWRHHASYSWSSTPSSCNRLVLFPVNLDALSVRATGILKAPRISNPFKIGKLGSDLKPTTPNLNRTVVRGQIWVAQIAIWRRKVRPDI